MVLLLVGRIRLPVQRHGAQRQRECKTRVQAPGGDGRRRCPLGVGSHLDFFQLGLLEPLGFGPAVLEPDLDLGLCQDEGGGEFRPLGDGEVLLLPELPLQGQELRGGERRARLSVGFVLPQRAGGTQVTWDHTQGALLKVC